MMTASDFAKSQQFVVTFGPEHQAYNKYSGWANPACEIDNDEKRAGIMPISAAGEAPTDS